MSTQWLHWTQFSSNNPFTAVERPEHRTFVSSQVEYPFVRQDPWRRIQWSGTWLVLIPTLVHWEPSGIQDLMKGTGSEDTTDPFRVCRCHTRQPIRVDYKVFQLPQSGSRGRGVLVLMLTSCVPDWIILDATDLVKFTFIRPVYWERSSGTWLAVVVIILASPPSSPPPPPPYF